MKAGIIKLIKISNFNKIVSIKDVIIGAPYEQNSDGSIGALYIFLGSDQGLYNNPYKVFEK
jgi:hypothetical protein